MNGIEVQLYNLDTSKSLPTNEVLVADFVSPIPGGGRHESVLLLMGMWLHREHLNSVSSRVLTVTWLKYHVGQQERLRHLKHIDASSGRARSADRAFYATPLLRWGLRDFVLYRLHERIR